MTTSEAQHVAQPAKNNPIPTNCNCLPFIVIELLLFCECLLISVSNRGLNVMQTCGLRKCAEHSNETNGPGWINDSKEKCQNQRYRTAEPKNIGLGLVEGDQSNLCQRPNNVLLGTRVIRRPFLKANCAALQKRHIKTETIQISNDPSILLKANMW